MSGFNLETQKLHFLFLITMLFLLLVSFAARADKDRAPDFAFLALQTSVYMYKRLNISNCLYLNFTKIIVSFWIAFNCFGLIKEYKELLKMALW